MAKLFSVIENKIQQNGSLIVDRGKEQMFWVGFVKYFTSRL